MTGADLPPRIETLAATGSTNADLAGRLASGEDVPEGFWLRAERQTGGRGRQGRTWLEAEGNLYASTVVHLMASDPPAHGLSFVAALAAYDALAAFGGEGPGLSLKWPNDIVAGGAKLAGILLERCGDAVVVGIGINLAAAPDVPDRAVTCLALATGTPPPSAALVAGTLAGRFAARLLRWRAEGLAATLAEWQERAHPPGTPLAVHTGPGERMEGRFAGLDPDGALRLSLPSGETRVIHVGDVTFA